MTIRNFDRLLAPTSVALIGASDKPCSVGCIVAANLLVGGFKGSVWLVNPRHREISGVRCYGSVADLPTAPDLAVIATPADTVPGLIAELARKGTRAAVVLTAGIRGELRQRMLDAAQPACLRIQGPNCLGLMLPAIGLNASFAHRAPLAGDLAFVSQSGALITAVVDWASGRKIGFSHVVSLGDMADADFGDLLDYLAGDIKSRAILLYMESLTNAPKFMSAARRAARVKPVIVMKAGRHAAGAKAAFSHTGALAGSDRAYEAAFRRAGLLRVHELEELFEAAEVLSRVRRLDGDRLMLLTNGGGAGVLAADRLVDLGGTLANMDEALLATLDAQLPKTWSRANPVDIIGDAGPERYAAALAPLLDHAGSDAILALYCPTALAPSDGVAEAVTTAVAKQKSQQGKTKPVLTCWLGDEAAVVPRRRFANAGLANFATPAAAVQGFMQLVRYTKAQDELMVTPPSISPGFKPDAVDVAQIIVDALAAGRLTLNEMEAKSVLQAYGIPVAATLFAGDPRAAGTQAATLLREYKACVLKIVSDDIPHKSDAGGVRLSLRDATEVEAAAQYMLEHIRTTWPEARLQGFAVQPMIDKPRAHEVMIGMTDDMTFGPMLMFGAGGTAVEILADTAMALPPLDVKLARDLIRGTRIARLLAGYRDRPAADIDAIATALLRTSMLIAAHPEIRELDINPLLVDETGVIALDARIRIADPEKTPRRPMAIRPYPSEWEKTLSVTDLGDVHVRPIRPEDEILYASFVAHVSPEDLRMRLLAPARELSHKFIARLTQIDYAREMAFVALSPDERDLLGVVRLHADPDYVRAEFAVIVRSDLKSRGLGWQLMQHLMAYARSEGLREMFGTVLSENTTMLEMCRSLGFQIAAVEDDMTVHHVVLQL